jgi:Fur family peroxide stress response transcriptional regulator
MKTLDDVRALFRAKKVPFTHQRMAVYAELRGRRDHPSAESLYASLKKAYPSLSLATVYKTLQTLHELGVITRVDSPAAQARYDAIVVTHHHAVCTACGKISDLFDARLDRIASPDTTEFEFTGHSVHFHGLCAACAKKAGRSPK